jgi:hypothetical protein
MKIELTCAFVKLTDLAGCINSKIGAILDHVRLWIETLLS